MSGNSQLGVLEKLGMGMGVGCCGMDFSGSSTTGLGNISFSRSRGCACFCICCVGCCDAAYDINHNGQAVGQIRKTGSKGVVVNFKPELDSRLKAIIVVGSFMLVSIRL